MQKLGIALLAVLLGAAASPLRMRAQDLAGGKERIRSLIKKELDGPTRLSSVAVAVVQRDAIVWEEAFGWADQQRRIAATPATP